jgi:hypothetical protein
MVMLDALLMTQWSHVEIMDELELGVEPWMIGWTKGWSYEIDDYIVDVEPGCSVPGCC